jgi:hypothetical protein
VGWTRISDFLPWMRMGDRPGHLVYHCRGYKMKGGFEQLPEGIREYTRKHRPEFAHAPEAFTSPNMTSWRYFKQLKEKKN